MIYLHGVFFDIECVSHRYAQFLILWGYFRGIKSVILWDIIGIHGIFHVRDGMDHGPPECMAVLNRKFIFNQRIDR